MKQTWGIIIYLLAGICRMAAQPAIPVIHFIPVYNSRELQPGRYYSYGTLDSVSIETLKFYISNIVLLNNEAIVYKEQGCHLLDTEDSSSLSVALPRAENIPFDQVQFDVGIDSITHMQGVMSGDLDPMKGMYWTWQSGYIHFKLEGKSALCPARDHRFRFHIGGYLQPFSALRSVRLPLRENDAGITILLKLDDLLAGIDLATAHTIMSPSAAACKTADIYSRCFMTR